MCSKESVHAVVVALYLCLAPLSAAAHGGESHEPAAAPPSEGVEHHATAEVIAPGDRPLSEFPTLHPLVVHFPIVLLLLAPLFELGGLLLGKRDLRTVATLLALGGLAGAFVAAEIVHPHTTGLGSEARQTLAAHERYALIAQWAALLAVAAKVPGHLRALRTRALDLVALLLLLVAAGAVSVAGHHGGVLTHLHGVGPQGAYLEDH